jgi:hypothetical protein
VYSISGNDLKYRRRTALTLSGNDSKQRDNTVYTISGNDLKQKGSTVLSWTSRASWVQIGAALAGLRMILGSINPRIWTRLDQRGDVGGASHRRFKDASPSVGQRRPNRASQGSISSCSIWRSQNREKRSCWPTRVAGRTCLGKAIYLQKAYMKSTSP